MKRRQPEMETVGRHEVIFNFKDNDDGGYFYRLGDIYPREGYTPADERIEALSGAGNAIGRPLIKPV